MDIKQEETTLAIQSPVHSRRSIVRNLGIGAGAATMLAAAIPAPAAAAGGSTSMWSQGNALTVESPENLAVSYHMGWGTDLWINSRTVSWFHIPVPTPALISGARAYLTKAFLLVDIEPGSGHIANVHLYDGPYQIKLFDGVNLEGDHRLGIDSANTFSPDNPYPVQFGLGVSFCFVSAVGFDSAVGPFWVHVAAAGGEFAVS